MIKYSRAQFIVVAVERIGLLGTSDLARELITLSIMSIICDQDYYIKRWHMVKKIKQFFDNPIFILTGTAIGAVAGGILGIIAYYEQLLG
ncbi:hypothetical protein [Oxobacter pfennigii]|nr:hypothetical protein [Oxobacter pfennigii]